MSRHDIRLDYLGGTWEVAIRKRSERHGERWQTLGRTGSHRIALRLWSGLLRAERLR